MVSALPPIAIARPVEPFFENILPSVRTVKEPTPIPTPRPEPEPVVEEGPIEEVTVTEPEAVEVSPPKKVKVETDCLLVSCSELVPLFTETMLFVCDESFLEESAINAIQKSIKK